MSAYDYDFYKNSEVKQEIINELAEEIFKDNVDIDEVFKVKMVDYLKKALIYGHTSRISS